MYPVSTPMPNLTGHCIGQGRLLLLEEIGSGGFGTVYRALDTKSIILPEYIHYAVKVLHRPQPTDDTTEPVRHDLEFTLQRSVCDHPNILHIYDVIYDEQFFYVILTLCPEGDLYTTITERKIYRQDDDLVKSAFVQIIDAVHHCHENGISHRDIKPENILCSADGSTLYLSDFGLATEDKTSREFGCGSTYYMSPG
jgi:serine/threonine protein kinase